MIAAVSSTVHLRRVEPSTEDAPLALVVEREGKGLALERQYLREPASRVEGALEGALDVAMVESTRFSAGHA